MSKYNFKKVWRSRCPLVKYVNFTMFELHSLPTSKHISLLEQFLEKLLRKNKNEIKEILQF